MRTLLLILLFSACSVEKPVQVKQILLTVKDIKEAIREDRGQMYWITWVDEEKVEYYQICFCPQYKVGDKLPFLITK